MAEAKYGPLKRPLRCPQLGRTAVVKTGDLVLWFTAGSTIAHRHPHLGRVVGRAYTSPQGVSYSKPVLAILEIRLVSGDARMWHRSPGDFCAVVPIPHRLIQALLLSPLPDAASLACMEGFNALSETHLEGATDETGKLSPDWYKKLVRGQRKRP